MAFTRKTRLLAVAAGAAVAALAAGGGVAYAGTPSPSPSQQTVSPHHVRPVVRHWEFDGQRSTLGLTTPTVVNRVDGRGAIPMLLWAANRDLVNPARVDTFVLGGNSVTLRHLPLPVPTFNLQTCTVEFSQITPFSILTGTGTGAGLRSRNGEVTIQGMISYPDIQVRKHYRVVDVCPLQFVTPFQVQRAVNRNVPVFGLPAPVLNNFVFQGSADVFRVRPVPVPYVTPSPYVTPADTASA